MLRENSPEWWEQEGEKKALATFHQAAERVPAYKDFLKKHKVSPEKVVTIEDFKKNVPVMTKKDYLRQYPLKDLCWDGDLSRMNVISVSSGSTGEPFFWPRDIWQEREVDSWYELVFRYLYNAHEKNTLVIIAFAMGMYIAGPFTYGSLLRVAQKGYPISITTPSSDIETVMRIIEKMSPSFDQTIIGGYPPLVREIIATCSHEKIDLKNLKVRLFFGGEGFSEKWRSYMHRKIHTKDEYSSSINMYGTADSSILGIETPVSIFFRKLLAENDSLRTSMLHDERLPSILTYNPITKFFEQDFSDGTLLLTASSGIPLIRYKIGDTGGVMSFNRIVELVSHHKKLGFEDSLPVVWRLPLVYLFGRKDFTVQISGANVYPENIKEALENEELESSITGKFILTSEHKRNMSPFLRLRLELGKDVKPDRGLLQLVRKVVVNTLRKNNSEYEVIYKAIGKKAVPLIQFEEYGHKDFKIKIKHPWTKKITR